jgi:hypothetical protein
MGKLRDSWDVFDRELKSVGFWQLKELSCKILDDGKMQATGTEVIGVMTNPDGALLPAGTLRDTDEKLESVTVGTPDQFTGTAVLTDHDKLPKKVVTDSNFAAQAEKKGGALPADLFFSLIGKDQLKKCFERPSV